MSKSNFIVRGGADFSGIKKGLDQTQKQLNNFQNNVSKSMKVVGSILGSLATGKLIKDATSIAMGVESAIGNIGRNMGDSSTAFNRWAETQSKAWGMARADAYKYGSTFSNLLASFSGSARETADNTQELMQAAAIIASKTGRSYEDTAERIRSGMLGSTEAIEDLGVYTNISMIESTNAFKKFATGKSWSQLSFQVQQQIRLAAILEQTYARYGDTLADTTQTKQARFIASLKNIQLNLGQAFLPIYNAVLPVLTALGNKLEAITSKLRYFTQALFGKAVAAPVVQTEKQAAAISGIGKAAEITGEQAKKAAKDIKGSLAGFDDLNVLADKNGASSGSEEAGAAELGTIIDSGISVDEEISPALQNSIDKFLTLLEPLKAINLDNLKAAFDNLKVALEPITQALFAGLEWAYLNIFVPLAQWTIEDALPAFLDILSGALNVLSAVLEVLMPLGAWLWEKFLKPIAAWTGGIIVDILKWIAERLNDLSDWIRDNKVLIQDIILVIGSFATAWGLVTLALKAWNIAIGIWNVIGLVATGITSAFGAAVAILTSPITLVVLAIGALIAIIVLLVKHWDEVKAAAAKVWEGITEVWGKASNWFTTKVLDPITAAFKSGINFLIGLAEGFVNGFINGINAIIDALNMIQFDIPDWVPGIGGKNFGINIPNVKTLSIPRLATGAVIPPNAEFMAILGDQKHGRNLEAPEGLIRQIIQEELSDLGGGETTIRFEGSMGQLIRVMKPHIDKENNRRGKNLIKGAPAW